ncbi:unnamed protein product [Boreogadus saida]
MRKMARGKRKMPRGVTAIPIALFRHMESGGGIIIIIIIIIMDIGLIRSSVPNRRAEPGPAMGRSRPPDPPARLASQQPSALCSTTLPRAR